MAYARQTIYKKRTTTVARRKSNGNYRKVRRRKR